MTENRGAKKLYKAHKTWIAAGIAAATLFSVQALGGQTVNASAAGSVTSINQAQVDAAKYDAGYAAGQKVGQLGANAATTTNASASYVDGYAAGYAAGHAAWSEKLNTKPVTDQSNQNNADQTGAGKTTTNETPVTTDQSNQNNADQTGAGKTTTNETPATTDQSNQNNADQTGAGKTTTNETPVTTDQSNQNNANQTGKTASELDAYAKGLQLGLKGVSAVQTDYLNKMYAGDKEAFTAGLKAGQTQFQTKLAATKLAEANQAFVDGQRYGETGAQLPDLAGKTANYKNNFAQGFDAGAATRAQKLASAKDKATANFEADHMGQATTPSQDTIDAASKLDEANTAFVDGQRFGETGAILPDLAGKSDNYKDNFAKGFDAGAATRAQKLAAAQDKANAENQANHMGQATTPSQDTIDAASKADEANTAFRAGQRYGETGAQLPDLAGKSDNYKSNFAQGFDAGNAARALKLTAQKAEANQAFIDGQRYGETGAQLPDLAGKSDNYKNNFAKGFDAGAATRAQKLAAAKAKHGQEVLDSHKKGQDYTDYKKIDQAYADGLAAAKKAAAEKQTDTTTTPTKDAAKPAAAKTTAVKAAVAAKTAPSATAVTTAAKSTAAALPTTGDQGNTFATAAGVLAVMGALFGLAGTSRKKRA
ncbi:LPXTG cell wall anchor domain-containing protein [Lacticaseibacillus baoqingensis]|uniref:LPXTG cell wall anchor domain-containing protein n=1 Tax=Lacticaseibacillus baoqingensis TaxID=2486013 RepID=A0ABW4EA13_9LACO|nr:LPXTG cell wall anchor domain-containing protein [Lacticaseibacillus baoqingensis]